MKYTVIRKVANTTGKEEIVRKMGYPMDILRGEWVGVWCEGIDGQREEIETLGGGLEIEEVTKVPF